MNLRVYVVWVPLRGAQEKHVPRATRTSPDPRGTHYWDGENFLGKEYQRLLGLAGPAWDVYLLFGADAQWAAGTVPPPAFWTHQLGGVSLAPPLDPEVFASRAAELEEAGRKKVRR